MSGTVAPRELGLELHGRHVAALAWGDSSLPPMLAVHGWMDNAGSFKRLAPLLAGRHHIVAIDLAGHGLSGRIPAGGWYHHVDYLSEIVGVVEQLDWPRLDILGHSMGGALAVLWAAAFPERVGRLISIDALGSVTDTVENTVGRLRRGLDARQQWQPEQGGKLYSDRQAAISARCGLGGLTEAGAIDLAVRGLEQLTDGYRWKVDRRHRLDSMTMFTEQQIQTVLGACVAPSLLIHAADSVFQLPPDLAAARLAAMPAVTRVDLAGGHHLHCEHPAAVAQCINEFVQAHGL